MRSYADKKELVAAIQTSLDKYLAEFADIPEALRCQRSDEHKKTPSEHLSYQLGWVNLLLQWEKDEQAGKAVHTPASGYQWNQLGKLYQHFYAYYGSHSLCEQQNMLRDSVVALCDWVATLSEPQLFELGQR